MNRKYEYKSRINVGIIKVGGNLIIDIIKYIKKMFYFIFYFYINKIYFYIYYFNF